MFENQRDSGDNFTGSQAQASRCAWCSLQEICVASLCWARKRDLEVIAELKLKEKSKSLQQRRLQ